jgi:pseudouridine synthase
MRINKYLAWKGYSTRRAADELITKKQVTVNGRFAVLGDKVSENDVVLVRNNKKAEAYVYYAYNKPRGIATEGNIKGTPSIKESVTIRGVFPVGSLDQNAQGLIILTNDRRIIDRLLNPAHAHVKEYRIRTLAPLRSNFKEKMESGVTVGNTLPIEARVHIIAPNEFTLTIAGNDSHIRQMCAMFFAEVESLTRTAVLNIDLGRLPANGYRKIEDEELAEFLGELGLVG